MNENLKAAIIKQLGKDSVEDVKEVMEEIWAKGGVNGFIHHEEIAAFFENNKEELLNDFTKRAANFGTSVVSLVGSFDGVNEAEDVIANTLYGEEKNTSITTAVVLEAVYNFSFQKEYWDEESLQAHLDDLAIEERASEEAQEAAVGNWYGDVIEEEATGITISMFDGDEKVAEINKPTYFEALHDLKGTIHSVPDFNITLEDGKGVKVEGLAMPAAVEVLSAGLKLENKTALGVALQKRASNGMDEEALEEPAADEEAGEDVEQVAGEDVEKAEEQAVDEDIEVEEELEEGMGM